MMFLLVYDIFNYGILFLRIHRKSSIPALPAKIVCLVKRCFDPDRGMRF